MDDLINDFYGRIILDNQLFNDNCFLNIEIKITWKIIKTALIACSESINNIINKGILNKH